MKAFISVDMEGMPYVVSRGHLNLKAPLYDEGRKIATRVTLIAAEELHKNGFGDVIIADSHGPMVNLFVDDLPEYVDIIRGFPRPLSMVSGIEECDIAMFLGYHAKFGTAKSSFDHTYSGGSINRVEVNGAAASEFLLNAYVAGELKVPVMLVAGEAQLLKDDVKKYAPWCEKVALKQSLSRVSARSPSMIKIEKDLRASVKKAVNTFRKSSPKLLLPDKPVKIGVTFQASHFADVAELLPKVKRLDGLKIEYVARDMIEAYKTFELLALAASAMSTILANQT
jgi:D-amino peptidase